MTPTSLALMPGSLAFLELAILFVLGASTLLGMAFWIWMLVDCIRHEDTSRRAGWAILIAVLHVVGALAYFFGRRRTRLAEVR